MASDSVFRERIKTPIGRFPYPTGFRTLFFPTRFAALQPAQESQTQSHRIGGGEGRSPTFTDILNAIRIPDSPTLAYHLKSLAPFIEQRRGTYHLTPMGKDAFNMPLKAGTYGKMALFQKKQGEAMLGNAVIAY